MEKYILVSIAKLVIMDKIMDKAVENQDHVSHSLTHNFDHNHKQALLNQNKLYHKLHNYY